MEQDNTPTRSWERPWTTEEMRQHSANWTLAGDSGLLKHLQQFSQNLLARTHSTNQKMDDLFEDLRNTTTEVNNVTNSFLSLSNTQFVESRVYDDEDKETPKEEIKVQELSKEQKQAQVVTHVSEALSLGMTVLDTMFNVVQMSGSDSEDEESLSSGVHTILEPKNPYLNRPLPYLIGSKEFMEDDKIGLGDPISITDDNVSLAPTHSSESDQEEAMPERVVSSSSECSDLESDQGALKRHSESLPRPTAGSTRRQSDSMFEVPDGEDMFGRKSPQESSPPLQVKSRGQSSFAEELAAKLGGVAAQDPLGPPEKPSQPARAPSKFADDLFSPGDDDDNDSLFGGGKFSTKSGLFDDLDAPSIPVKPKEEKTVPAPAKQISTGGSLFSDDLFNAAEADDDDIFSVSTVKKPMVKGDDRGTEAGDKKPPGGVSIFGKDLFGSSDNAKNAPKRLFSVPDHGDGIFTSTPQSRNEDSDGLFGSRITPNISNVETNSSLFANVDEDDLFSTPNPTVDVKSSKVASSPTKKLPAGAVSIFGQDLFAKSPPKSLSKSPLEQSQADTTSDTNSDGTVSRSYTEKYSESGLGQASGGIRSQEFKSGVDEESLFNPVFSSTRRQSGTNSFNDQNVASDLFREEVSGDSLFQKPKAALGKSATASSFPTSKPTNRKPVSLFDSDSDESDLFSRTSSPSIRSVDKGELEKRPLQKKSLFSNDELLFESRPSEPNFDIFGSVQAEKPPVPKPSVPQNKIPVTKPVEQSSLLDENDEDIDIFAPRTDKMVESKSKNSNLFDFGEDTVDDIFAVPRSKTKSAVNLSDSLFEDVEDLFPVSKPSKSISERLFEDLESGSMFEDESSAMFKGTEVKKSISKPEPPSTLNIRKTTDLFSGNGSQDLFGSSMEKQKPESESSSSSSKISKNGNNKISLFEDLDESAIEDIFKKTGTSRVKDIFSDVSDKDSKTESISKNVSVAASTAIEDIKQDTGKQFVEVPESSSKSQKPQVTPKSNVKEADIKSIVRPEIMPRSSKMPTDNSLQDSLKEKPTIAPRTDTKINSDQLKPKSELSQDEKVESVTASRPTVSSRQQEPQVSPSKGIKSEIQGVAKAPSIRERGKIINPAALLPGSRPAKVLETERSVSFEEVVPTTTTLHSAAKERAKIPVKRRPQSRRARQEAIRSSAIFDDDSPTSPGILDDSDESSFKKSKSETFMQESKNKLSDELNVKEVGAGDSKQDTSPLSSPGESTGGQPFRAKRHSPTSLFSPETDEGEDLFGMPQDLPDYDPKEDLGGNLFGGAPVLSPLDKRIPSFQSSTSHVTVRDENIPKADSQLPSVSKSPQLFETNSDSLFGSNSTIPKASVENLFSEEIQSAIQTESTVSKPEKKVDSLFDSDSDKLFSSSSKSENKDIIEQSIISKPRISEDKDLFFAGTGADKNSVQNKQNKTKNVDDLFASTPSVDHSDIFKRSKKLTNAKNQNVKDDLFPTVSDDKGFGSDMEDSLFKADTKDYSSKGIEKSTGIETRENRIVAEDDLFGVASKSRPTQSKSVSHPNATSTADTDSVNDLFGAGSASLPVKSLSTTVDEDDLFSVKTKEDNYKRMNDDDLFGSVPAKSRTQVPISTQNDDDLFFVKAKEHSLEVKGDDNLFGSVPVQVKSHPAPLLVEEDEDLFSVKASSNTKDVLFGTENKSTLPSNLKSQKVVPTSQTSSLFDEGAMGEDDMFSAGPSKRKTSNASSTASTIRESQTTTNPKKPMKKSLFDDDDDDDIFNTSTSKAPANSLNKPAGPGRAKVAENKSDSSNPTSTVSAKQNTDFEDPLMALRRD